MGAEYARYSKNAYRQGFTPDMKHPPRRFRFAGAFDAAGVALAPAEAVVVFDDDRPAPACTLLSVGPAPRGGAALWEDRPGEVLLPAFVNAHTHLDLTHIGPRDHDPAAGFDAWLAMILTERRHDAHGIAASVEAGAERCLAGGVVAVGDIAGVARTEPVEALRASALGGVSYVEFFGLGARQAASVSAMEALAAGTPLMDRGVRLGLSPHAPYTAGPSLFDGAAALARSLGLGVSTHLAESAAEREFVADARGPMRALLHTLGVLDDAALADFGHGARPAAHLSHALARTPWLLAHCGDLTDEDIALLAATPASVAYCPRSSEYFGHHTALGPHRYRDLLAAGVNLCLGTDSIVNLPRLTDGTTPTLGVLDEMRHLHQRDGTDPVTLLAMGTIYGARALGLDPAGFTLATGSKAGLTTVRASGSLSGVLTARAPAQLLLP